jgi:nucleotide-binding universal stress UspA family protein
MSTYPFERILLATEHDEFDAGAERIAFAMAKRCGIPLRAVIPIESNPEYEVQAPELFLRGEQAAAVKVALLRERAREGGVELEVKVRHGMEAYREIVDEATASHADLIVIRRRGKPGFLSNRPVGEMVSKVIRDASCAVLTVPRSAEFWRQGVLAAASETPAVQRIVLLASGIAVACDLPLTLVSVAENEAMQARTEDFNGRVVAQAAGHAAHVQGRVLIGEPVAQICAAVKGQPTDLIVIGRQRYHLIPFMHGSTSIMQKIIGATEVSTLVVPAP